MKENKTVWKYTREGFWVMIIFWILNILFTTNYETKIELIIATGLFVSVIFTFVNSIIHLTRYKKKAFAITALVFSSYYLLTFIIGFIFGILMIEL